jgi:hypothetical protein
MFALRHKTIIQIEEPLILETKYMANISIPALELNETKFLQKH